ncbi:DUF2284 domain-containing protein [Candidatus Harpocratesius sp.]
MNFKIDAYRVQFDQIQFIENNEKVKQNCQLPYKGHKDGCPNFGFNWSCPPYSSTIKETRATLSTYQYFWLIRIKISVYSHPIKIWSKIKDSKQFELITDILNDFLEKFRDSHAMETIYFCSECRICKKKGYKCTCPDEPCRYPNKIQFSPESVGIDIFKTFRELKLEIEEFPKEFLQRVGLIASNEILNFPKIIKKYQLHRKILSKFEE